MIAGLKLLAGCRRPGHECFRRPGNRQHLAFGYGPDGCPGSRLVREQLRLTPDMLLRRMPELRLDERRPEPRMQPAQIHRSPQALCAAW
ncbi:hypothetical protein OG851_39250 [Streptomyces sp. NBC_00161]|uniref:hypothetical protein n=1 Tax=Streptomyces sp. NBC_00161 TaxID=2975671 RepID=UPI00324FB8E7